ncbi:hypothetical protein ANRL1_02994 [Anaerolineae bacterium]|nr:hypothetical protein ANRL1_02994 [Anaerolineae bacterium]
MPAVSGSSGRLIISPPKDDAAEHTWPGQVFEDPTLDYTAAMQAFVAASIPEAQPGALADPPVPAEKASRREQKRRLRRETLALRDARRQTRRQRKSVDAAWRILRQQRHDSDLSNATWQPLRTQRVNFHP